MVLSCLELAPAQRTAVPLREFAAHLRLSSGFREDRDDDAVLEMYLRAATAAIEARLGIALVYRLMALRVGAWSRAAAQNIPVGPVANLQELAIVDAAGQRTVLGLEDFTIGAGMRPAQVRLKSQRDLPPIPVGGHAEIRFVAGYGGDATDVPADLRQAVHLLAAHYFEHRDAAGTVALSMPLQVLALLEPFRLLRI